MSAKKEFDWDEWIIPPVDSKGHHVRMSFQLQPGHARMIEVLMARKCFPFRTPGELIRWCVVTGITKLDQMESTETSFIAATEMITEVVRDDSYNTESESAYHELGRRIHKLASAGEMGEARRILTQTKGRIDRIANGVYRRRMTQLFREQFGTFLSAGTVPTIIPMPKSARSLDAGVSSAEETDQSTDSSDEE